MNTAIQVKAVDDGAIVGAEGWHVRFVAPDLLEYSHDAGACLVNVDRYSANAHARQIYASESSSELFPKLREHLQTAARYLKGHYIVV